MRKLTLVQRFTLLCLVALAVFGTASGWLVASTLEEDMLHRSNHITASIIAQEVRNEFKAENLRAPKTGADYESFTQEVKHLSLGPDVERVKIWNRDGVVVWADDRRLVGERFSDNPGLAGALAGKVMAEVSTREEPEQELEREFGQLLELYVPVRFGPRADVEVVFEVYQDIEHLYAEIAGEQRKIWLYTGAGFSLLFLVLIGIMKGASNRIQRQTGEIVRSEEKYRSLVESAQDGIVSIDCQGKIVLFNRAAEGVFGYSAGELMRKTVSRLMPERYRPRHEAAMERYFRTGETTIMRKTVEMEGRRKNGQDFPAELTLTASGKGEESLVTAVIRDISERKAMQTELIEGEKRATVALVAGSIGHELKNVATALLGYAGFLKESPGDRELAEESAGVFDRETQRLTIHAANLLALSKPQAPEKKPVSVECLLDRVTEVLRTSGVLKAFTIKKEYTESLPEVPGDAMQLEQVIRNLEINAAHAMKDKGTLTIRTRFSRQRDYIEFDVADTGSGIPEDKMDQIFLPFYTTKKEGEGTGLGMWVVKQVIEQHGGYVRLKSEPGYGTTMTIGLPVPPDGA